MRSGFYTAVNILCVLSVLFSSEVKAQAEGLSEEQREAVEGFVVSVSDEIISTITSERTEREKEDALSAMFDTYVDTGWMAQFVIGRYNRKLSDADRAKYVGLYHRFMRMNYVPKFRLYEGQTYEIQRVKPQGDKDFIIDVIFKSNKDSSPNLNLSYRISKSMRNDKGFMIRDVVGEGISFVVTQRSDFGSLIKRKGIETFIEKLEKKVAKLEENNIARLAKLEAAQ